MANFNGYVLTEAGRELLAKGLSGEKIEFTKMQIGDGVSSTDARSMSSLVNPKKDLNIISIRAEGGQCKLGALLSNKDLQTGFYIKELGVFARGNDNIEKLYAYNTSPNPDFIPPFSSNNIVEIEYVDTLIVDRATNITALIDPSITYITKETADQTYLNINEKMKWMGTDGYGGLLQDVGTKKIGIAYYDKANKQMVVPTVENTLTYFEGAKFIPISDYQTAKKLENLFRITEYKNLALTNTNNGTAKGYTVGNIAVFSFHDISPVSSNGRNIICKLPVAPIFSFEGAAVIIQNNLRAERFSVDENGGVRIIGDGTIQANLKYSFSFSFPFSINV